MDDKLNTPLSDLHLSVRTMACLKIHGMKTVGDVAKRDENELLRMPNFGRKSLNELREIFSSMGVRMRWAPLRKYVSFRVDDAIHEKLVILSRSSGKTIETEIERLLSEAVGHIPSLGDLATRLDRLEHAVFGVNA